MQRVEAIPGRWLELPLDQDLTSPNNDKVDISLIHTESACAELTSIGSNSNKFVSGPVKIFRECVSRNARKKVPENLTVMKGPSFQ